LDRGRYPDSKALHCLHRRLSYLLFPRLSEVPSPCGSSYK
jgi:hypothetical protein